MTWRAPVASLNVLLTSTCWRNDHNGFSHQGPGLIDTMISMKGEVVRVYFPPDANSLLVGRRPLPAQPRLRQPDRRSTSSRSCSTSAIEEARAPRGAGASVWDWAGTAGEEEPDVVLGCAGDIPTLETLAAAWLLRSHTPELRVRVVNVVDLMALFPREAHPHGLPEAALRRALRRER